MEINTAQGSIETKVYANSSISFVFQFFLPPLDLTYRRLFSIFVSIDIHGWLVN